MNPARLLQHFDRIAEAPDAIPRLRRFILDLAVRASWWNKTPTTNRRRNCSSGFRRKARLVKEGKIKKQETHLNCRS